MDKHLNLFYSYNRDNELVENNLTRAFIVSLSFLNSDIKNLFLNRILEKAFREKFPDHTHPFPEFQSAEFALQNSIPSLVVDIVTQKYILAIATDKLPNDEETSLEEKIISLYNSVPDGWIYSIKDNYCFLIESKVGQNPLNKTQLASHSKALKLPRDKLSSHAISIQWWDVLESINWISKAGLTGDTQILNHLKSYLGFFGYEDFSGFNFLGLNSPPGFSFSQQSGYSEAKPIFSEIGNIKQKPRFELTENKHK
jgi:hypothetical protein